MADDPPRRRGVYPGRASRYTGEHFGDWGYRPLDFERVRQAREVLEHGLVTQEGEPIKNVNFSFLDFNVERPAEPGMDPAADR